MIRRCLVVSLFVLVAAVSLSLARAQEMTTDAERSWRELRGSEDVKRKLLAERWYSAIRQQDWSDATGKFKTSAKYVAHDPQLAWVKLRVIQGAGDKRVVKDVQIPLEKLSKTCQARVSMIAKLSDKITEAIEAEKKAAAEGEAGVEAAGGPRDEMMDESRGGRGEMDGGLAGMDAEQVTAEGEATRAGSREAIGAAEPPATNPPVTNDGPPLPAVIPRLPQAAPAADPATAAPAAEAPAETPATERAPGNEAWRTSYDAFLANITPVSSRSGMEFEWGELQLLQQAHQRLEQMKAAGELDEAGLTEVGQKLKEAGEVHWEATLASAVDPAGDFTAALGLPPLPAPLRLRFIADPDTEIGPWQNLVVGQQVRFTGRFLGLDEEHCFTVAVRLAEDPPGRGAATPEPAAEAAPGEVTREME